MFMLVLFRDADSLIDVLIKLHNGLIIIRGCAFLWLGDYEVSFCRLIGFCFQ